MKRTASFEYDPEDIPKLKDHMEVMMMQIKDEAYQKGIVGERERILHLADSLICFDHHKGCEHAACYAMSNLIGYIKEGTK
jgi:hypothetical protein